MFSVFPAFMVAAFFCRTIFRAPMLAVLAALTFAGATIVLITSGSGVLEAFGWALLAILAVEAAFVAGPVVAFVVDDALVQRGRRPVTPHRRRAHRPAERFAREGADR